MRQSTVRASSVFRDGALPVMDHSKHLIIYLRVVNHLRQSAPQAQVVQAWREYEKARARKADCFLCQREQSARIAKAALRGYVKSHAPRTPKPHITLKIRVEPQTAAEQKQRDEQFATYQSTPAMQGGQVYIQKAD